MPTHSTRQTLRSIKKWNDKRRARRAAIRQHYAENYDINSELARGGVLAMSARL